MLSRDEEYFYTRAEAELRMAQAARDPGAMRAHYTLAGYYLDRAYGGGDQQASPDQIRARLPIPMTFQ
jgi:hypothetical protein